jgi:hypothetical protein
MTTINVGDKMVIESRLGGPRVHSVEKVHKRYFVCGRLKWAFPNAHGWMHQIGAPSFATTVIRHGTPERIAEVQSLERRRFVADFDGWGKVDQSIIDAVHAIITKEKP